MQKRRNSIADALELRLFCMKPWLYLPGTEWYMYNADHGHYEEGPHCADNKPIPASNLSKSKDGARYS